MRASLLLAAQLLLVGNTAAFADSIQGSSSLALAALIGAHSPQLRARDKTELAQLLDGHTRHPFPAHKVIEVRADSVSCRAGDVDITSHSCALAFGKRSVSLNGRAAHELFATLIEAGVKGSGAAGTIYESVAQLACTVEPHQVAAKAGGGASCTFTSNP